MHLITHDYVLQMMMKTFQVRTRIFLHPHHLNIQGAVGLKGMIQYLILFHTGENMHLLNRVMLTQLLAWYVWVGDRHFKLPLFVITVI